MCDGSTKGFIHAITEQHFKDPWLSLVSLYGRDSTSGHLPKEETAGVQHIPTAPSTTFNSLISASTPPLCSFSLIPQTRIGHSEAK